MVNKIHGRSQYISHRPGYHILILSLAQECVVCHRTYADRPDGNGLEEGVATPSEMPSPSVMVESNAHDVPAGHRSSAFHSVEQVTEPSEDRLKEATPDIVRPIPMSRKS